MDECDRVVINAFCTFKPIKLFNDDDDRTKINLEENDPLVVDALTSAIQRKYTSEKVSDFVSRLGPEYIASIYSDIELVWYTKDTLRAIFCTTTLPVKSRRWFTLPRIKLSPFRTELEAYQYVTTGADKYERKRVLGEELWDKLKSGEVYISRCAESAQEADTTICKKKCPYKGVRTMLLVCKRPTVSPYILSIDIQPPKKKQKLTTTNEGKPSGGEIKEEKKSLTCLYDIELSKETYRYTNFTEDDEVDDEKEKNVFMMSAFQSQQYEEKEYTRRQRRVDRKAIRRLRKYYPDAVAAAVDDDANSISSKCSIFDSSDSDDENVTESEYSTDFDDSYESDFSDSMSILL